MRRGLTAVVGGVSQLYQGDLHFGRAVLERLEAEGAPADVAFEHFDYGAVAVVQRLEELRPKLLVLVGAVDRGRPPGALSRRAVEPQTLAPAIVRQAVAEAVTGYVTMDLLLEVATGLGALPAQTVAIEFEPVRAGPQPEMSSAGQAAVDEAVWLVRAELKRAQSTARSPARAGPAPAGGSRPGAHHR